MKKVETCRCYDFWAAAIFMTSTTLTLDGTLLRNFATYSWRPITWDWECGADPQYNWRLPFHSLPSLLPFSFKLPIPQQPPHDVMPQKVASFSDPQYREVSRFTPYLLTPWSRVLLEKLASLQLVKKFPAFYGTRRLLTALTSARHLSLSWASPMQSSYPNPTSWRSILIRFTTALTYLLTYVLTYSTEQSPSWEANRFSASQEMPRILWNPKFLF